LRPELIVALDSWIAQQPGFPPSRQEVIRHFLEKGIGYKTPRRVTKKPAE